MQFHHNGYVSTEPRIATAAGYGQQRPTELPDEIDVLIVGAGPAGVIAAAQLTRFPHITTHVIEKRAGRLELGKADGIQARSVETFAAFGFAERVIAEAYRITEMAVWSPNPDKPGEIIRTGRTLDDPDGAISEFPHLIVNQARILDYFSEVALRGPGRITPDFGWEFLSLEVGTEGEYPVAVKLKRTVGEDAGAERTVHAKYVIGCDGAHSRVRKSIGRVPSGDDANHAWGVMDVIVDTDFPDWRLKCTIHSEAGSILLIPREGGFLNRVYVDLGVVPVGDPEVRNTPVEEVIRRANEIFAPYRIDVKNVAWNSVYEVGHRVTDKFDETDDDTTHPRVFICGDACHTHSAKAGQGMNVSMQDGWNISWKLAHVLSGRADASILHTYSAERQEIAQNLIDFDRQWSSMMARKPEEFDYPGQLEEFYEKTFEFPAGFMTQYKPNTVLCGTDKYQQLAAGFPLGKRFKSAMVIRRGDNNPIHMGHEHEADGRWRIYVFADAPAPGEPSKAADFGRWLGEDAASPVVKYTPAGGDDSAVFESKIVYQQDYTEVEFADVPAVFKPHAGKWRVQEWDKVLACGRGHDIFETRGVSRDGAVVVVRPDQYVAAILPLDATAELAAFFDGFMLAPEQ